MVFPYNTGGAGILCLLFKGGKNHPSLGVPGGFNKSKGGNQ